MRFLEYYDVPGITIDRRFLYAQRLVSFAKKQKTDHAVFSAKQIVSGKGWNIHPFLFSFYLARQQALRIPLPVSTVVVVFLPIRPCPFVILPLVPRPNLLLKRCNLTLLSSKMTSVTPISVCNICIFSVLLLLSLSRRPSVMLSSASSRLVVHYLFFLTW